MTLPLQESRGDQLSRYVKHVVKQSACSSHLCAQKDVPRFEPHQVVLGTLLGTGSFNQVYELKGIQLDEDGKDCKQELDDGDYAVKFLKADATKDAAADLMLEATYLSSISHPNIIQLHGISSRGSDGFKQAAGFFLILERVDEVLPQRMDTWKRDASNTMQQRLEATIQLSCALQHLHSLRMIYRDIKPTNIGFSGNTVKLLDLGLSKELNPRQHLRGDLYKMSGGTGCRRYMSPECHMGRPYGLSADVYSFGLLLWHVMTMKQVPTQTSPWKAHRLAIPGCWPQSLKTLERDMLMLNTSHRPSMKQVHLVLKEQVSFGQHSAIVSDDGDE